MSQSVIYFNGKFVPETEAVIPISTHALHYGGSCWEGIRAYYNVNERVHYVFKLEEHFKRLHRSSNILFIKIPHTVEELCQITKELIEKNFEDKDIYIRPIAYKADIALSNFDLRSVSDGFSIYVKPLGRHFNKDGIKAIVSSWTRTSDNAIPARAKIGGTYINTTLAKTESTFLGYDEALLMDNNKHIVEASIMNIFMIRDGKVITPPLNDDILEGITRDTMITLLKNEFDLQVIERSIDRTELYQADEIFLTGTGAEISSVIEVDGRTIGTGEVGNTSSRLKELYGKVVHGEVEKYKSWLTKVES